MNFKIYTIIAALALPMAASAQNTERKLCDFESADAYRSIKVYDTWENSPFRKNSVEGNIQVVQNHLNDADPVRGFAQAVFIATKLYQLVPTAFSIK